MRKKTKILHIISDTNVGGAGRLLLNLSEYIDKNKFELEYAIPRNSRLYPLLKRWGRVHFFKEGDCSANIFSIPTLYNVIKASHPDIVHTHSSLSGRIAAVLCGISKQRIVYSKHCVFDIPQRPKIMIMIRKCIQKITDGLFSGKIIAVAEAARDELVTLGSAPDRISVIINGSISQSVLSEDDKKNLRTVLGIDENDFVVGMVARLEPCKGHKTFIKAAKLLLSKDKNFKFLIVGDGSCREELIKYTSHMGIFNNVIFTGYVSDVWKYLNLLDINVNCSTGTETSNLSISEGLSLGIPAIVSDFGGNPNMVINGITGMVFGKRDPNELYKIIYSLKKSPQILKTMGLNARKDYQKRFSVEKMAEQYEDFYIKMLKDIY